VSSRRSHLILVVLIVLALVGVAFLAVPGSPAHRSLKQGLDLQGGLEYVLKAQPPKGVKLTAADLDRSVSIMRNRVDKLGVSEPIITKQGSDQISIQLAGVHNVNQAASIIGSTAQLERLVGSRWQTLATVHAGADGYFRWSGTLVRGMQVRVRAGSLVGAALTIH